MTAYPDPEALPPVFSVQTASRVLGIGKNQTYDLIKAGRYPVRVLEICGRYRVSRYDLLRFLGAEPALSGEAQDTEHTVRSIRLVRSATGTEDRALTRHDVGRGMGLAVPCGQDAGLRRNGAGALVTSGATRSARLMPSRVALLAERVS
ncbi:MAG TPA: helix-turn-helix domain-containing protein [Streptosporangiaceae bacterium]